MGDIFNRIAQNLAARLDGPLHFRFFFQPAMATFFAVRDGIRDARSGEPAYFWSLCSDRGRRADRLRHAWRTISRVFTLGVLMDVVYQLVEFHRLYPGEALIVATGLAIVPYLLFRGPVNRLVQRLAYPRRLSRWKTS